MAVGFRLSLRRVSGGRLSLTIPWWFRFLLLAAGLLLLYALLSTSASGIRGVFIPANTLPLLLCAISLFGACYQECWTFDRPKGRLVYQTGLLMVRRRRTWPLPERVEVGQFIRGRPPGAADTGPSLLARPVLSLSVHMRDGEVHRLELYAFSQKLRVRQYAREIASYCGIKLVDRTADPD